jgi:hypothetical protein
MISQSVQNEHFIPFLNRRVLSVLLNGDICPFIFHLTQLGLVSIESVTRRLFLNAIEPSPEHVMMSYPSRQMNPEPKFTGFPDLSHISFVSSWFFPELEQYYPLLVRAYFRQARNIIPRPVAVRVPFGNVGPQMGTFTQDMFEYQANNWKLLRELRISQQNPHPIARAIDEDDLELFQSVLIQLGNRVNFAIPPCPFDNIASESLLTYAAKRRALRVVRHLLLNGADVGFSQMMAAIQRGDPKIVRLLDEKFVPDPEADLPRMGSHPFHANTVAFHPPSLIPEAITYDHADVFHWLIATNVHFDNLPGVELSQILDAIFRSHDFNALTRVIELGVDVRAAIGQTAEDGMRAVLKSGFVSLLLMIVMLAPEASAEAFPSSIEERQGFRSRLPWPSTLTTNS